MGLRSVPAPFLRKTYLLVDDGSTDDVISWNENGTAFVVWKTAEFAKDLLPNCFKHNNFSSFVRQLNTYGFRKSAPDKWEFANENFRQGRKELLTEICRRKSVPPPPSKVLADEKSGKSTSPSSSRDDLCSTSTLCPHSKSPGLVEKQTETGFANLSEENESLRMNNEMLNSELARTKKQCDELMAFLPRYVKMAPDQINCIIHGDPAGEVAGHVEEQDSADDDDDDENWQGMKLFGVYLKEKKKKRGRNENIGFSVAQGKIMKTLDQHVLVTQGGL